MERGREGGGGKSGRGEYTFTHPSSVIIGIWSIFSVWKISAACLQVVPSLTVMGLHREREVIGWPHHHSAPGGTTVSRYPYCCSHLSSTNLVLWEKGEESRKEGGKEGRRDGGKEGGREGGKDGRREGRISTLGKGARTTTVTW